MQAPFEPLETQNDTDSPCSHQGKVAISPEEGGDLTRGQRLRSLKKDKKGKGENRPGREAPHGGDSVWWR